MLFKLFMRICLIERKAAGTFFEIIIASFQVKKVPDMIIALYSGKAETSSSAAHQRDFFIFINNPRLHLLHSPSRQRLLLRSQKNNRVLKTTS